MKKSTLTITLSLLVSLVFISCSNETENTPNESENTTEQVETEQTVSIIEEESPLGKFKELVGMWTVDAKTAGVKMDLTFGEDGSFKQNMGQVKGEGTWEALDEEHVNIVTQNTTGQKWKITDLTKNSVNLCWNPDKPNPKTIPMQRVK